MELFKYSFWPRGAMKKLVTHRSHRGQRTFWTLLATNIFCSLLTLLSASHVHPVNPMSSPPDWHCPYPSLTDEEGVMQRPRPRAEDRTVLNQTREKVTQSKVSTCGGAAGPALRIPPAEQQVSEELLRPRLAHRSARYWLENSIWTKTCTDARRFKKKKKTC